MDFDFSAFFSDYGLLGVALSAFTSATVLPGTSEAAVLSYQAFNPSGTWLLLAVASAANTAGSMCSYLIGRLFPNRAAVSESATRRLRKYGASAMLLCWVPVVGDAIPLAAGWLRVPAAACTLFCALGKTARYAVLLGLFKAIL